MLPRLMPLNDLETPGSREPSQACPSGLLLHLRLWGGLSLRTVHALHVLSQTDRLLFSCYVVFRLFCAPRDCSPPVLCPWDFPGKKTGAGCHSLSQGTFLTQGLSLLSCAAGRFLTPEPAEKPTRPSQGSSHSSVSLLRYRPC